MAWCGAGRPIETPKPPQLRGSVQLRSSRIERFTFKEFRPASVSNTCRDAAKRLREIDNAGVDPAVIDHVNRVIRGFEQMGAIAETKGRESLWRDATSAVAFVIKVASATRPPGAVADGGSLAIGIGASEQGGIATREGQAETIGIANDLMASEE